MKYSTKLHKTQKEKKRYFEGWNSLSKKLFLIFVIKLEILNYRWNFLKK